ncbi:MAG: phenylacetate-CoA oxygenase subunit PaaI [Polyangiaceae bacterium]|nr:phenylacetate-CoA oxygenase subunit PaaI [Myxococcales bacterium]MCC6900809.1 phenylacetate-CoA oxygenase subunit PaaI [Polyangiaceae bacterium]
MTSAATPTCGCFRALLERQGYRELAAAQLFSSGVALAPTLDEKQMLARHCLDELEHFEVIATELEDQGGGELLSRVTPAVAALPTVESWLEMVAVGILFDRAVYHQLRAYAAAPDARVAALAVRVIADEQEHIAASQAALRDLGRREPDFVHRLVAAVDRWLPASLACFDDETPPACGAGPHVSVEARNLALRTYREGLSELLVPEGVPQGRFAG